MDRSSEARWTGDLKAGKGTVRLGSGVFEGPYNFLSRFENGTDTNPEELLGAAHAACYSMALAAGLAKNGNPATSVTTTATVHLTPGAGGSSITSIDLKTVGVVPGISVDVFRKLAEDTKVNCIISKALAAVPMTLDAQLANA